MKIKLEDIISLRYQWKTLINDEKDFTKDNVTKITKQFVNDFHTTLSEAISFAKDSFSIEEFQRMMTEINLRNMEVNK